MFSLTSLFDGYSLRARLLPALLLVLPPAIVCALLFPAVYASLDRVFGSLGFVAVGMFFLAHVVRERGRRLQQRLYREWGGVPTTLWLRHRDTNLEPFTKGRYHRFLEARIEGLRLPSSAAEIQDPVAADHAYASAVTWLLEFTRDTKAYPLVFSENVYYGFRRNTLAARPIALVLFAGLAAAAAIVTIKRYHMNPANIGPDVIAAWIVLILSATLWVLFITKAWAKDGAFAYARALLAACESTAGATVGV